MKKNLAGYTLVALGLIAQSAAAQTYNWTTIAGLLAHAGSTDGTNSSAYFNTPTDLAVDADGNLIVIDSANYTLRRVVPVGTNWLVTTIAGQAGSTGNVDGTNSTARFYTPSGLALDGAGNIYTVDSYYQTVRKITPAGTNWVVSTIAGQAGLPGSVDGTNNVARFSHPLGIVADALDNLYVADSYNYTIRKVQPVGTNWVVTTIAGLAGWSGTADGTNSAARFTNPGIGCIDTNGVIYVTDTGTTRKLTQFGTNWVVTTLPIQCGRYIATADTQTLFTSYNQTIRRQTLSGTNWLTDSVGGSPGVNGAADGTGTAARFYYPAGIGLDATGRIYVSDSYNHTLRQGVVLPTGLLQVWIMPAEAAVAGAQWRVDGGNWQTNGAMLSNVVAGAHSISFASIPGWSTPTNQTVTVVAGQSTTTTGWYVQQFGALQVMLSPAGAISAGAQWQVDGGAWQGSGSLVSNLSVASHSVAFSDLPGWATPTNQAVAVGLGLPTRAVGIYTAQGSLQVTIRPVAAVDGGAQWRLDGGPWLSSGATVAALSPGNHRVAFKAIAGWIVPSDRVVAVSSSQTGELTGTYSALVYSFATIAGLAGSQGYADGMGETARFSSPARLAVDSIGRVAVADTGNSVIRLLTPSGTNWVVSTIAGLAGTTGSADGTNGDARFNFPAGVAFDLSNHVFVADQANSTIRELTPNGTNWVVKTIAGAAGVAGSSDGALGVSRFYYPAGIGVGPADDLFVADEVNSTIRQLSASETDWTVDTVAGLAGAYGSNNGTNSAGRFYWPCDVAVDTTGIVYVADTFNSTIRAVAPAGANWVVSTIAGVPGYTGIADGTNGSAQFNGPSGIAVDGDGNVYVADTYNSAIRKLTSLGTNWIANTIGGLAGSPGAAEGTGNAARFNGPQGLAVDADGNIFIADTQNGTIRRGTPVGLSGLAPFSATIAQLGGNISLNWDSVVGRSYGVEYSSSLLPGSWIRLGGDMVATNVVMSYVESVSSAPRYYRVVGLP